MSSSGGTVVLLSWLDDIKQGCFAVEAFEGVDDNDGLEYGS